MLLLRLKPYEPSDAPCILSWCKGEKAFYQWTAGVLGPYPLSEKGFNAVEALTPFTALDPSGPAGFFTLRDPGGDGREQRFGFVIVAPEKRGRGYGKEMLALGLRYAFETLGAARASLGVFENNPAAIACYKGAGFKLLPMERPETYCILGENWPCLELGMEAEAWRKQSW